jgi:DNA-binding transcriptional LysR family regulator
MHRPDYVRLEIFATVAAEQSFRRAAAKLNMQPSSVSHAIAALEAGLSRRLLHRTTRSVTLTEAGEHLLAEVVPALNAIASATENLSADEDAPTGTVRLTVPSIAASLVIMPALAEIAERYPGIVLDISRNDGFVDLAAERFDCGIRLCESVAPGMIAVPVSLPFRIAVAGSPGYFDMHPVPEVPADLKHHRCIGYRQIASGALYRWEFDRAGESIAVPVEGPLILDDPWLMRDAALAGVGLVHLPDALITAELEDRRLIRVLEDWCEPFAGLHLYYASRRHMTRAVRAVVDALRLKPVI